MDHRSYRKQKKTFRVNGVRIVNPQNANRPQKDRKDPPFEAKNLVQLADKDNLEL